MTDWLRQSSAPVSDKVWAEIVKTAVTMAKQTLVARRIIEIDGPRGWNHVASQLGTFKPASVPSYKGTARFAVPDVMLLTEIRADFKISWAAIDIFERVGPTLEPDSIEAAARDVALAEDQLVFYGGSHMPGILTSPKSPKVVLSDWSVPGNAVTDLLRAVENLDELGVKGPYEVVMSPEHYYAYLRTSANKGGSYPAAKQLGIVIAKVYSSPVVEGAVLFSTRGGDFLITIGGDFSVGYRFHDEHFVHLFCVETVAAQLLTPEALCVIREA